MDRLIHPAGFPVFPLPLIEGAGNFGVFGSRKTPFSGNSGNFGEYRKQPILFSGTKVTNGLDYLIGRASA
jgi:hypothetical protein